MNLNYIDSVLFFLLMFICLILYDSHKIISFIKKHTLSYTKEYFLNKSNNNDIIKQESDDIVIKQESDDIVIKQESDDIVIKQELDDDQKLFNYLTHPDPYNETFKMNEDNDYDPMEQYLKTYNPKPLELENKKIRGHNFNKLDIYPKITQFGGKLPLQNNEFDHAVGDGYIFKDSASI